MAPPFGRLGASRGRRWGGRLRPWSRPSRLPRPLRYLHGCNLSGRNFPASLRPAPRDAAARPPRRWGAAPEPAVPRAAASPALPQRAAVRPPRPAPGRPADGLVTCPRRPRNRSDPFLSASARPLRLSTVDLCLHKRRTRKMHAAGPWISGLLGVGWGVNAKRGLPGSWSPGQFEVSGLASSLDVCTAMQPGTPSRSREPRCVEDRRPDHTSPTMLCRPDGRPVPWRVGRGGAASVRLLAPSLRGRCGKAS